MNFIKNVDKKYLIMFGSLFGVIIVLLLSVLILSACNASCSYEKIEKKLVKAAEKYIESNPIDEGLEITVTSEQLVTDGYIKDLNKLKNDNCTAIVTVMNNGGVYNYLPNLTCTNYKTVTLKEQIINDSLTSKDDGLYALDGEYVFKGKEPKNYISFAGNMWLIIKINTDGTLKLISLNSVNKPASWDTKYNEVTQFTSGENDYRKSDIAVLLNDNYLNYDNKTKKHLIQYSVCIGRRNGDDLTKSATIDCSEKMDNQYVGLMNIMDFMQASLDKDCLLVNDGSCINYNYFYENINSTWTANAVGSNSYEAIQYIGGRFLGTEAREKNDYNLVVNISGEELYKKGDGSFDNPYVID